MFIGEFNHNLDSKGRMAVPVKFRTRLAGGAIITRGLDHCLFVFTNIEWETLAQKLISLPLTQANSRAFVRLMLSGAADVLINNAGVLYSAPLVKITPAGVERHDVAMWNKVLAADLNSVFFMTVCVVEKMITTRTKGVIVNISSVSAAGNAGQSAYSAAKAGVNALTAVWAKELSLMGIRVVAVAPGFTETESTRQALSEAVLRETVKKVPLKRLGRPEEIADGVISVIENDFFNGKVFELDGGLVL